MTRLHLYALAGVAFVTAAKADIVYNDFSSTSGLQLNGNATTAANALRLTSANFFQSGSAFSTTAIPLVNNSFSTRFQFKITSSGGIGDEDGAGADGLVFAVQTVANNVGGAGGGIGYQNIPQSVGIEFDTYNNGLPGDPNGNHVGIDLNGSVNSVKSVTEATRFNDGNTWTAWVDYNGTTHDLEVRYNETGTRPASANLSYNVDLSSVLQSSSAFVGFTSGTGSGYGNHDILNWTFTPQFQPIDVPSGVPDSGSTLALLGMAAFLCVPAARRLTR